jgi:uncharacterized protein YndB with AHSA1/START domain
MTATELLGTVSRDRGAVHLERTIPAAIDRVWAAWTTPERMAWLAQVDGEPNPGATFVLAMDDAETATCTVNQWRPPHLLELTWDYTGEGPSRLRIELFEAGGGATRLVLDHDLLTGADPVDYGAGWHVELELLAAYLAGEPLPDFASRYGQLRPLYDAAV